MNDIFGDIGSARGFSQHAVQREIRCTWRRNGRVRIDQILVRLTEDGWAEEEARDHDASISVTLETDRKSVV